MVTCTFFGHSDSPDSVRSMIKETIACQLMDNPNTSFLVGNHGNFDRMVLSVLKELEKELPVLDYSVVLAYLPEDKAKLPAAPEHTLYPEGIETVPKRFTIAWRNKWMVGESDVVICYISRWYGGAAKYVEMAQQIRYNKLRK